MCKHSTSFTFCVEKAKDSYLVEILWLFVNPQLRLVRVHELLSIMQSYPLSVICIQYMHKLFTNEAAELNISF